MATNRNTWLIGVDFGQKADYTALSVTEQIVSESGDCHYHVRHLERLMIGIPYTEMTARIKMTYDQSALTGTKRLIVDATGVGQPVVDMLDKIDLRPIAITITGGNEINQVAWNRYHVPKRNLVSTLTHLLGTGRLKVASELAEASTLIHELKDFKVKIDLRTAHDAYGAWREGEHDDIVLSLAVALWVAENAVRPID